MKQEVLHSIIPVITTLRHVEVSPDRVRCFCETHAPASLQPAGWRDEHIYPWDDERAAEFFLLFNCVNFAFWKKPGFRKWYVIYRGREFDGAYGLMAAFTRAIEEGIPLLDGAYLGEMTEERFSYILRGGGELVLFPERVALLREVGRGLVADYGGSFAGVLNAAGGSASRLARILIDSFPSFNDRCVVDGREVKFYKRAQLAPAMIYGRFEGKGPGAFDDIDDLTVFADYKLPQILRAEEILRYDDALATAVDSRRIIAPCSREEIEIRAATIHACELIMEEYRARGHAINAVMLDSFLWLLGHRGVHRKRPYHLTETIYY